MLFFSLVISFPPTPEVAALKESKTSSRTDFDHGGNVLEEGAIKAICPAVQTFPPCFRQSVGELG